MNFEVSFYKSEICAEEMVKRDTPGYAIGGLAGGEDKADFCRTVFKTA